MIGLSLGSLDEMCVLPPKNETHGDTIHHFETQSCHQMILKIFSNIRILDDGNNAVFFQYLTIPRKAPGKWDIDE